MDRATNARSPRMRSVSSRPTTGLICRLTGAPASDATGALISTSRSTSEPKTVTLVRSLEDSLAHWTIPSVIDRNSCSSPSLLLDELDAPVAVASSSDQSRRSSAACSAVVGDGERLGRAVGEPHPHAPRRRRGWRGSAAAGRRPAAGRPP